jgi:competence ComEA-like helix-hairpin-helix protein
MNMGAAAERCLSRGAAGGQEPTAEGILTQAVEAETRSFPDRVAPLTVRQRFLLGMRIDINRAGWEEIAGLPGISDKVARAVVETRERIGGFRRDSDLLLVKGIKEKRLKNILPFILELPNN